MKNQEQARNLFNRFGNKLIIHTDGGLLDNTPISIRGITHEGKLKVLIQSTIIDYHNTIYVCPSEIANNNWKEFVS